MKKIELTPIGTIRTPYRETAPYQPVTDAEGEFYVELEERYTKGLYRLDTFKYIYLIYYIHRPKRRRVEFIVSPPWTKGFRVGVFASRSPIRPNRIAISVVELRSVQGNRIYTSGLDAFDGTPLLDIKPYIRDLDSKDDSNHGWIEMMEDRDHLTLHLKGIPHDY